MNPATIEKSIRTAAASLEMEGFSVDSDCMVLCKKRLSGEITMEEYLIQVKPQEVR